MAEYWKSLPRKYCEACKCWFADNKSSIDFHERGKRHQENVAKRISEIRKKGQKEYEAKLKYESDMKKIEAAALKAFQKDLKTDHKLAELYSAELPVHVNVKTEPGVSSSGNVKSECHVDITKVKKERNAHVSLPKVKKERTNTNTLPCTRIKQEKKEDCNRKDLKWFEARSPEGCTYYYNSDTGQSQWQAPAEGYVSIAEQAESGRSMGGVSTFGPKPRHDPYGQWAPVEEPKKEVIDYELPTKPEEVQINISVHPEPKVEFKEKTVTNLMGEDGDVDVQFKKRKKIGEGKRNVRARTSD